MKEKTIDPFFTQDLESGVKEVTYDDVLNFLGVILEKGPHHAVVEELEGVSEYLVSLEKLLEEKGIAFDSEEMRRLKFDYENEIKDRKKGFLLYFAGKIVRKEGP